MDRRRFLSLFGAGVAGIALEQAVPLGRVWSFPKKIKRCVGIDLARERDVSVFTITEIRDAYLTPAAYQLVNEIDLRLWHLHAAGGAFKVGDKISIWPPQRYQTTITLDHVRGVDVELS